MRRGHAPKVLVWGLHLSHRTHQQLSCIEDSKTTFSTRPFIIYVFVIFAREDWGREGRERGKGENGTKDGKEDDGMSEKLLDNDGESSSVTTWQCRLFDSRTRTMG